ncbi:MAG TPA: hypothetical protein VJU18_16000, partial [Vicinamibacteria bacterium]|nr:hypothetical protein [Vicinamibacteria bacterium]
MNCPACGQGLPAGLSERCPFCATLLAPPAEGALAPNLSPFASALLGPEEPLREIPGLRKRERTWKDEVKERVSDRRRTRSADAGEADSSPAQGDPQGAAEQDLEEPAERTQDAPIEPPAADASPARLRLRELDAQVARLTDPEELLLRPREGEESATESELRGLPPAGPRTLRIDPEDEPEADDWSLGGAPAAEEAAPPVERPAAASERLLAAALDTLFWGSLSAVVVY